MSRATPDDQLKFLLSCVKHSNNGKIDFVEVAKECGVVSKGAAAKRYERLMKANGIHPSGGSSEKFPQHLSAPKEKSKAATAKAAAIKKRKIEGDFFDSEYNDQEDIKPIIPKLELCTNQHIKSDPINVFTPYAYPDMAISPPLACFPRVSLVPVVNEIQSSQAPLLNQSPCYTSNNDNSAFDEFCSPDVLWQTAPTGFKPEMTFQRDQAIRLPPSPQEVVSSGDATVLKDEPAELAVEPPNCILIPD